MLPIDLQLQSFRRKLASSSRKERRGAINKRRKNIIKYAVSLTSEPNWLVPEKEERRAVKRIFVLSGRRDVLLKEYQEDSNHADASERYPSDDWVRLHLGLLNAAICSADKSDCLPDVLIRKIRTALRSNKDECSGIEKAYALLYEEVLKQNKEDDFAENLPMVDYNGPPTQAAAVDELRRRKMACADYWAPVYKNLMTIPLTKKDGFHTGGQMKVLARLMEGEAPDARVLVVTDHYHKKRVRLTALDIPEVYNKMIVVGADPSHRRPCHGRNAAQEKKNIGQYIENGVIAHGLVRGTRERASTVFFGTTKGPVSPPVEGLGSSR